MGNYISAKKINFEKVLEFINNNNSSNNKGSNNGLHNHKLLITVLNDECLIRGTIPPNEEEYLINTYVSEGRQPHVIIYGKNYSDEKVFEKYKKIIQLGWTSVYIYIGGMFEWLLLQEMYGDEHFPTTCKELDILKYTPKFI